jgi:hypothetical protein
MYHTYPFTTGYLAADSDAAAFYVAVPALAGMLNVSEYSVR